MQTLAGGRFLVSGFNGSIGGGIATAVRDNGGTVLGLSHVPDPDAAAVTDFTDDAALAAAVASVGGPLAGVVISHGIIQKGSPEEVDPAGWRRMLDVNLNSSWTLLHAALPLIAPGGSVVVISSTAGLRHARNAGVHYTVSKWGLNGMVRHLATDLGPRQIRVNAICPGHMDNAMSLSVNTPETLAAAQRVIPLRRSGTPEDIASCAVFLLSPASGFITGTLIPVAGGMQ